MTSATTTAPGSSDVVQGGATETQEQQEQPFPPPLVPETLHYRLETGNIGKTGGQRGSLTRCAQKFGTLYSKVLVVGTPPPSSSLSAMDEEEEEEGAATTTTTTTTTTTSRIEDIQAAKNDLDMELELYLLEATKLVLNQQGMQGQVEQLLQEQIKTSALLEEDQASVQLLRAQVAHAKEIRNCQLEYEALAKLTNDKFAQPKRIVEQEIQTVQEHVNRLQQEVQHMEREVQVRDSQFQLLMQYLLDLKRSIQQDQEDGGASNNNNNNSNRQDGGQEHHQHQQHSASKYGSNNSNNVVVPMQVDEEEEGLYGDL